MTFRKAVYVTYKSSESGGEFEEVQDIIKTKFLLIGIVPNILRSKQNNFIYEKRTQNQTLRFGSQCNFINPDGDYTIKVTDEAYMLINYPASYKDETYNNLTQAYQE